jgi:hypothetical protein
LFWHGRLAGPVPIGIERARWLSKIGICHYTAIRVKQKGGQAREQ